MFIIKLAKDVERYLQKQRLKGNIIGFVPTMGALHRGHLSLIEASKKENSITVCSIFINPAQFNDSEDFQKYPVTLDKDIYELEKTGCEVLFLPSVSEIYPDGVEGNVPVYDLGYLETILEGKYRPGHFQGVCRVMDRLMHIIDPHHLYLGQKDYQQCMVITKLLSLIDARARIHVCTTLREPDGLAMSSRNMRLNEEERKLATGLYESLTFIKQNIQPGPLSNLLKEARKILEQKKLVPDYIEIATVDTLSLLDDWDGQTKIIALIAAFMGNVRLIDNMILPFNFAGNEN
ncbi:MAG: pantoate--beta-alanine ligase [Chitinophagaceae bacterium]|nr:pantoate--beta-alanine ligase [Chitinophagaceae bacterium]